MNVPFWTLTLVVLLIGNDGKPESMAVETHPVPFLTEANCDAAGEAWSLEVVDALDSDDQYIVSWRCSTGNAGLGR